MVSYPIATVAGEIFESTISKVSFPSPNKSSFISNDIVPDLLPADIVKVSAVPS